MYICTLYLFVWMRDMNPVRLEDEASGMKEGVIGLVGWIAQEVSTSVQSTVRRSITCM